MYNKFYSISQKVTFSSFFLGILCSIITLKYFQWYLWVFQVLWMRDQGQYTLQFVSLFRTSTIYLLLVYSLSENSYPKAFAWKFPLFSFLFFPFLLNYFLFVFSYFKSNIVDFLSITIFFEIPDFLKKMHFSIGYEPD
jgi:hypothetical protein